MKYIISLIQKYSSGKNVILFFMPAMVVYASMLIYTIPGVEKYSNGMRLFDLMPWGYSYEYAKELLTTLGEVGRELYLFTQIPLDLIYPSLFAISCSLLLSWLLLKSKNRHSRSFYCCLVPILAGIFDYAENLLIIGLIKSYPELANGHVAMSSLATIAKSVSTMLFFVLLLFFCINYFSHKQKNKKITDVV